MNYIAVSIFFVFGLIFLFFDGMLFLININLVNISLFTGI